MDTSDMRNIAAELFLEHGPAVFQVALRASAQHVCEGRPAIAHFWYAISLIVEDLIRSRLDPDGPLTLH